jgi:hypothetical protein
MPVGIRPPTHPATVVCAPWYADATLRAADALSIRAFTVHLPRADAPSMPPLLAVRCRLSLRGRPGLSLLAAFKRCRRASLVLYAAMLSERALRPSPSGPGGRTAAGPGQRRSQPPFVRLKLAPCWPGPARPRRASRAGPPLVVFKRASRVRCSWPVVSPLPLFAFDRRAGCPGTVTRRVVAATVCSRMRCWRSSPRRSNPAVAVFDRHRVRWIRFARRCGGSLTPCCVRAACVLACDLDLRPARWPRNGDRGVAPPFWTPSPPPGMPMPCCRPARSLRSLAPGLCPGPRRSTQPAGMHRAEQQRRTMPAVMLRAPTGGMLPPVRPPAGTRALDASGWWLSPRWARDARPTAALRLRLRLPGPCPGPRPHAPGGWLPSGAGRAVPTAGRYGSKAPAARLPSGPPRAGAHRSVHVAAVGAGLHPYGPGPQAPAGWWAPLRGRRHFKHDIQPSCLKHRR